MPRKPAEPEKPCTCYGCNFGAWPTACRIHAAQMACERCTTAQAKRKGAAA
jgi:hypothetical protein